MKSKLILKFSVGLLSFITFLSVLIYVGDDFNLGYKNKNLDKSLPNPIDYDSFALFEPTFDLPILYIYSYDIEKLIPDWSWAPDAPLLPLREESYVDLYVFNRDENNLDDIPTSIYPNAIMNLRGRTSSYLQDKKPFSIKFKDDEGLATDVPILNLNPESSFVLHAPLIDRSLIRNYLGYTLQSEVLDYAPETQFVEVLIDVPDSTVSQGDYVGVYLLVEKIKQGNNRVNIQDFTIANDAADQFYNGGGYIFKRDHYEVGYDDAYRLESNKFGNEYSIVYPDDEELTELAAQTIFNELELYETALYTPNHPDFEKYYDIEQIARAMLVTELLKNHEGFTASTFFYRDVGGKIKYIQWDFDIGTGNFDFSEDFSSTKGFYLFNTTYAQPFLEHDVFIDVLIEQWELLREEGNALSEEFLATTIDDVILYLNNATARNSTTFPNMYFDIPFGNAKSTLTNSYEEQLYIREYILSRGEWIDENIHSFKN